MKVIRNKNLEAKTMKSKHSLLILFVLTLIISHSGCLEDTYETEYINEQFEVKSFGSTMMYGERYFIIDYIDDNRIRSVSNYYDDSSFRNYNIINVVDSDKTYLVYDKVVTKYASPDIYIVGQPTYVFHYYTLYWGDIKIEGTDSEYREGRYPIEQVSIQYYP